ncbi:Ig-like domain-containing protein [Methylobacterium sp. Leaf88]|uniref:Ig-like domain-containing protein n=1 Tax=Methylobacterium sp. Leaf88 TaxID=1736244 RepID=UPI000A8728A9|nr:Ig-like domain-containing protein [Methylobacterium sp. Leaf88]
MVGLIRLNEPQVQVNAQPGNLNVDTATGYQGDAVGLLFSNDQGAVIFEDFFAFNNQDIQARFISSVNARPTGVQLAPPGLGRLDINEADPSAAVLANLADPSIPQNRGLVVWAEQFAANDFDIVGRLITANGDVLNANRFLLAASGDNERAPDVAALSNGRSVVAWHNATQGTIQAEIIGADGQTPIGVPFRVDTQGNLFAFTTAPVVAGLTNNNFVIAWVGADVSGAGIHAQVFDGQTGAKLGNEIGTADNALNFIRTGNQDQVAIAALSNGNFAVAWRDDSTRADVNGAFDTSGTAIKVRIFDSAGTPLAVNGQNDILVNTATAGDQSQPSITAGPNGGFVVGWTDASGLADSAGRLDALGTAIKAQAFAADGFKLGGDLLVNTVTSGNQFNVDLTTGSNGVILATFDDLSGQVDTGGQTADPSGGGVQAVRLRVDADSTAPAVTVSVSDADLTPGETANVTFQFSEKVVGFTASDVAVGQGALGAFTQVDDDTFTGVFTPNANFKGSSTISVAAASYTDEAGNAGFAGQTSVNIKTASVQAEEVYRFFNTNTGGHFFTVSENERNIVQTSDPVYRAEGIGFGALEAKSVAGAEEVYRFFNTKTGGHFFTTSEFERDQVIQTAPDYRPEGIGFYEFEADQGSSTDAVYRFYNTKTGGHFFTVSENERNIVSSAGGDYRFEGIAFYAPDAGAFLLV